MSTCSFLASLLISTALESYECTCRALPAMLDGLSEPRFCCEEYATRVRDVAYTVSSLAILAAMTLSFLSLFKLWTVIN